MKKILTNVCIFNDSKIIKVYTALWDTGSTESLISSRVVKDLNLLMEESIKKKISDKMKDNFKKGIIKGWSHINTDYNFTNLVKSLSI